MTPEHPAPSEWRERVAGVLGEHVLMTRPGRRCVWVVGCSCGLDVPDIPRHVAHVADALLPPMTAIYDQRVTRSPGALYSKPRRAQKRRRCDGHLAAKRHWIEPGDLITWSALPPGDNDIGNVGWWHAAFCVDCAPHVADERERNRATNGSAA